MKKSIVIIAGMAAFAAALFGDPAGYFVKLEAYDVEPGKAFRAADEIEKDHAAFRAAGNIPKNLLSATLAPKANASISSGGELLHPVDLAHNSANPDAFCSAIGSRAQISLLPGSKGEVIVSLHYLDDKPDGGKEYVSGGQVAAIPYFDRIFVNFDGLSVMPGKACVTALRKFGNSCRIYALSIFSLPEATKSDPDLASELRIEKLTVPTEAYAEFDGSKASFEKLRGAASKSDPVAVMPIVPTSPSSFEDVTVVRYPTLATLLDIGNFTARDLGLNIEASLSTGSSSSSLSSLKKECEMRLDLSYSESALASEKKIVAAGQIVEIPESFKIWNSQISVPIEPKVPAVAASRQCENGVEALVVTVFPKEQ